MSRKGDVAAFVTMAIMWALNYPLLKIAFQYEPPLITLFFRILIGGVASLAFAADTLQSLKGKRVHTLILLTGILNSFLFMAFWFLGEETESASISSIIIYTFPIINIVFSYLFLNERIIRERAFGSAIGFAGLILIFWDQLAIHFSMGIILLVLAAVSWSGSAVIYKKYLNAIDARTVNALQFIYSLPFVAALSFLAEKVTAAWLSPVFLGTMLYMGVPGTAVAYLIYFRLIRKYEVSKISGYFFTVPAFSVLLSFFLLGEINGIPIYIGFALIAAGMYIGSMK